MKITKKVLSILLSLMLVLGAVAGGGMSVSAERANNVKLSIGGVDAIEDGEIQHSEGTDWSIIENEDGNGVTLNLDNLNLTYDRDCIIAFNLNLTITGSAKLTSTTAACSPIFLNDGNLTLNGNFIFRAQKTTGGALSVNGNLTVEGGSLDVINAADNNAIYANEGLTVNGGSVYAESSSYTAIHANEGLTVNGGSVYAKTESDNHRAISAFPITLNNNEAFALGDKGAKEVLIKVPGQPPYITGDIIEYGTYPQSEVKDATLLASLNNLAPENFDDWTSYGYYYNDSGETYSVKMQPGDFMRYYDAVLDGVKYRAVKFTAYRPQATDYACSADYSFQDDNGYLTNTAYWFRFEPIEWRILDPEEGLILCGSAIDSQAYNNYIIENGTDGYGKTAYWGDSAQTYYANNYAESSIRQWLNYDFMNTAFSASQQENIKETELNNDAYSNEYSQYNSAQTNDKVFLLSYAEATNRAYGFNAEASNADTARWLKGSDYAKCQGLYVYSSSSSEYNGNSYWKLRSPGNNSDYSCGVNVRGYVDYSYNAEATGDGVRPAMRLNELKPDPTGAPFTVDPGMTLTISPEEPVWGDDITITATLPENATGTVTFRLDEADTGVEATVENGKAVYAIEGKSIEVDNYTVLASYSGGERYNSVSEELPLKIKKAETEVHITVEPENPLSGQEISITVTVDGDATISPDLSSSGTINNTKGATLFIDGSSMDSKYSGTNTVTFNVPGLDAGEHNIKVVYNGDEHYKSANSETVTINIGRAEPDVSVTVMLSAVNGEAVAPGESVTAEVGDKLTFAGKAANNGNVTLTNVIIHDRLTGTDYAVGSLKPGEVSEDTLVLYTVTAADAAAGKIVDSVKVTAEVYDGETVSSVAEVEVSVRTEYKVTYIVDGEELTKMDAIFGQSVPQPRTPQKEGYTFAWVDEIPETMPAEDVTINGTFTIIKYTATFVKEDGTELETREYDVETTSIDEPDVPAKQGYEGKWSEYTLALSDIEIAAEYTAIEYTATFVDEKGETVAEVPYTVESGSIEAPAVPVKEGYNGEWEEYELTPGGITVKPVYTPADICPLDNDYHGNSFWGRLVKFFHTVIWKAFNLVGINIYLKIW